jgi:pimeloyl-ACP methyl ester carboxylesterase
MRYYNKELEKYYTVVILEQRGSGKSYYRFKKSDKITIDTYVEDAYLLIKILLTRFKKQKVFLMGHSWGSVLGLKLILKYPEVINTYIGCGQVINMIKGCKASYDFALQQNVKKNNQKVVHRIEQIDCTYSGDNWYKDLLFITKQVVKYRGSLYNNTNYNKMVWRFIKSKEYSLKDIINRQKGCVQGIKYLWQELMHVNFEEHRKFEVSVIFIEGRHDYHASSKEVEKYYHNIISEKKIFWFENSAHFPQWSESQKFNTILSSLVK